MARKKNGTLAERAYQAIKLGIVHGDLEEGTFLSEPEILKRFAISRTPFREACNRLQHEQLLEVVPHRGYLVSEISFRSVREMFEARLTLESAIAGLAARRASPQEIEDLEEKAARTCTVNGSESTYEEMVKWNTEFHLCMAQMTRNRELVRLITGILERTERLSYLELRSADVHRREIQSLHLPIVEAIKRKDIRAARQAVIADISQGELDIFGRRSDEFYPFLPDAESGPDSLPTNSASPASGDALLSRHSGEEAIVEPE